MSVEAVILDLDGVLLDSEQVKRGKRAPEVDLEAARRLGVDPTNVVAIKDSENGIRSARAAGMRVLAVPNPTSRPPRTCSARRRC